MSWKYPHTVLTRLVTSNVDGTTKLEGNPIVSDTEISLQVDFQPNADPDRVFREWGIEVENPAVMYAPPTSLTTIPVNTRVTHESLVYVVLGVKKWETGQADLDYVKSVLKRLNE